MSELGENEKVKGARHRMKFKVPIWYFKLDRSQFATIDAAEQKGMPNVASGID